jgi:UDP-glucose 4-epimerase
MNILILGGAGFVGANLVRRCLKNPENRVTVVDSLEPRLKSTIKNLKAVWGKIRFVKADIRNRNAMERLVCRKDAIFNCAAQSSHTLSVLDPFFDVSINCIGNLTLLEAVRRKNKRALIVYPSSSTVIGKASAPVDETSAEAPLDIYSADKSVVEKYYRIYNRVHDLKTIAIRFANLFGPYGKGYPEFGFINYFIAQAAQGKVISIYGSGRQKRTIMYIEDAVDLLYDCVHRKRLIGGLYFAVHKERHSVIRIAKEIVRVFPKGKIRRVPWPDLRRRVETDSMKVVSTKLERLTDFRPRYSLKQGLKKTKEILESQ